MKAIKSLKSLALAAAFLLAAFSVRAAQNYWKGSVDSNFATAGNWSQGYAPSNSKNDWVMFHAPTTPADKLLVVLTGAHVNKGGLQVNNIGSEEKPFVFRAKEGVSDCSFQFGTGNATYIANYNGDAYVRLESATYSTGNQLIYVGSSSAKTAFNAHLTVAADARLNIGTSCEFSHASTFVNCGVVQVQTMKCLNKTGQSTFTFDGGTLVAGAAGTLIANDDGLAVEVTANGGTLDTAGKDVTIAAIGDASGETGAMLFKGGGSAAFSAMPSYTGGTTVELGTSVTFPSAIDGSSLTVAIPAGTAAGVYPVISISGSDAFANDAEKEVICADANAQFMLSGDKKSILCVYGYGSDAAIYVGGNGGSLSESTNWAGGVTPAAGKTLVFSTLTSATTVNADFADDRVFSTVIVGSGVLTLTGDLHLTTLTNASTLAVAQGASLTIDGDLVAQVLEEGDSAAFLYSNEGTVTVGGKACGYSRVGRSVVYQYQAVTANTQPIRASGLTYDCAGSGQLYMRLYSASNKAGMWIVGSNGMTFTSGRNASYTMFYADAGADVTIGSSADWTLTNSGKSGTTCGDLWLNAGATLTLDTSDYDDPAVPHVITLKGRVNNAATAGTAGDVTIAGCGKVVVDTTGSHASLSPDLQHTYIASGTTLAVTDMATLQVNAGKKITGGGTITLGDGAKLLIPTAGSTVTLPSLDLTAGSTIQVENLVAGTSAIELSGSLIRPTEGKATLKIGGTTQLAIGSYTVLSAANALPANAVDHLTLDASEVVSGDCSLSAEGGDLLLHVSTSKTYGIWVGGTDDNLSTAANWLNGEVPRAGDTLNFMTATPGTTVNADFSDDRVFSTVIVGSGVLTLTGDLHLTTLTNASTLAVAQGASLTIDGDLVGYAANDTKPLLYSNEGTVTVGGKVQFRSSGAAGISTVSQYAETSANTQPIVASGLAYNADSWSDYLVANLGSMNNGVGKWVIGENGLTVPSSRNIAYSGFRVIGQDVSLCSAADWTLDESYRHQGNDLYIRDAGKVTIDTTDWYDRTAGHVVTFRGFINEASSLDTALEVSGCGTLVLNTNEVDGKNNVINSTLAVTDTATLQVNAGKSLTGDGKVSLGSGARLLVANAGSSVAFPSLDLAAGSTIEVENLVAGSSAIMLSDSLILPTEGKVAMKIGGTTQLADGIYTVVSAANALPEDAVDHLTLDASEVVSGDCSLFAKGGALLLLVGISEPGYGIWVGGTDDNLTTAANWLNGEVPRAGDTLNFKTAASGTTVNADAGDDCVFANAVFGAGVVNLTGNLHLATLTNASTLAVAQGASLTIDGDLVAQVLVAKGSVPFLYSNEGTVTVGGKACGYSRVAGSYVFQYQVVTANTQPIRASGLTYDCAGSGQLNMRLYSASNKAGMWIVGSNGMTFTSGRNGSYTMFYAEGNSGDVTIGSSADWTLANSGKNFTTSGDLWVNNLATLTLDTSDCDNPAVPHVITLKGRIVTSATAGNVTIAGCGKVVVDTTGSNTELPPDFQHTCISNSILAVTDTATLQVNAGKKITGNGTIALGDGTTLALGSVGREFATPEILPVTLPTGEGEQATVRIDGDKLRGGVDHVLFEMAPTDWADHLKLEGSALDGRKTTLKEEGGRLLFNIEPRGFILLFM